MNSIFGNIRRYCTIGYSFKLEYKLEYWVVFSDTKVKFLSGWIPEKWCKPDSKLYHFDNESGQVTVKRGGIYWAYGQVVIFCRKYALH